ncbi:MAG TPA: sulfate ABC transporter permease subunit CysT [Micropepsaceae bacterium]|nr:sulfate ABC transporter permease subunit CysT [Micropepsaceae bacterium]
MNAVVSYPMSPTRTRWREPSVLPGFGPALGFTLFYLSAVVLVPLAALVLRPWELGFQGFFDAVTAPRVLAALRLSFGGAAIAAAINGFFGLIVAWVMVRYDFPFKRFVDALIDLPFALPTAVAGIALTALYGPNGWIGSLLAQWGMKIAYTPAGVIVAMTFIGLPFVVRTLEPVLEDFDRESEEVAATLGATRLQTCLRVVLPGIAPALITGTALAFARGVGEYGSIIFIAGNIPLVSEIAPLVIVTKLEQFDYAGAAAVGVAMLAISFLILLAINVLQAWAAKRQ